jgi:O-antigen/teichoic acid export membrane protein
VGSVTALTQVDLLIVKGALSSADAGVYAAASTFARLALFVPITLTSVLFPRVAARVARGEDASDILGRTIMATAAFCVVLFGGLSLFGGFAVRLAFGEDFSRATGLLPLFGLGTSFFCLAYILASYHLARSAPLFAWILAAGAAIDAAALGLFHRSMEQVLWVNAGVGLALLAVHEIVIGGSAAAVRTGTHHMIREARERDVFTRLRRLLLRAEVSQGP